MSNVASVFAAFCCKLLCRGLSGCCHVASKFCKCNLTSQQGIKIVPQNFNIFQEQHCFLLLSVNSFCVVVCLGIGSVQAKPCKNSLIAQQDTRLCSKVSPSKNAVTCCFLVASCRVVDCLDIGKLQAFATVRAHSIKAVVLVCWVIGKLQANANMHVHSNQDCYLAQL